MSTHRIARAAIDESLRAIVRGGERIDSITCDVEADEYVVITEDRIEIRPAWNGTVAPLAKWDSPADGSLTMDQIRAIEAQP